MKKTSRLLSLLLTVLMMVGMVSVGIGSQTASALTTSASTWTSVGWTYTDNVNNAISSISWDMVSGDAITCGVIYMRLQAVVTWGDVVAQINGRNPSSSTLLNKNNSAIAIMIFYCTNKSIFSSYCTKILPNFCLYLRIIKS